jgi:hypothetical protein
MRNVFWFNCWVTSARPAGTEDFGATQVQLAAPAADLTPTAAFSTTAGDSAKAMATAGRGTPYCLASSFQRRRRSSTSAGAASYL